MIDHFIESARLTRQSYGLAMAQTKFGGPRGIWLECCECPESQVIVGSNNGEWETRSDADAVAVFRRHGWTGEGERMLKAKCPACSSKLVGGQP